MKKHLLLFVLALFSFCMGAWASDWGDGACGGALWKFSEGTGTLTIKATTIPGAEDGVIVDYTDAELVPWYDERSKIKQIVLDGITHIGQMAFFNLPNLTSVTFDSNLKTIGKTAFQSCTSLETIDLRAATSLTIIDYWAFGNCYNLSSVKLPNSVTTIGQQAFTGCAINTITLPTSLTTIGTSAFFSCPITSLTIPANVTSIGTNAFDPSYLTSISVNSSNTTYKVVDNYLVQQSDNTLFLGINQQTVTIPSSISAVGQGAFAGCDKLTTLTLLGQTLLREGAFSYCTGLKTINCDSETPSWYSRNANSTYDTFGNLTKKNIKLYVPGNSLTTYLSYNGGIWSEFDVYVRSGESAKFNLVFKADGETVSTVPVEYRQEISESNYPVAPEKVGHTFSQWTGVPTTMPAKDVEVTAKYTVNSYTITYMVDDEQYGDVQTFEYGANVTPPTTPTKDQHKFSGWNPGIPSTMPAENLTITGSFIPLGGDGIEWSLSGGNSGTLAITGSGAMYNYTSDGDVPWLQAATGESVGGYYGINNITIADGITTIGDYAFFKCNSNALTTVTLPNALVAIGKAAFAHCSGLTSITIPADVKTIGADAFRRCTNLSSVTCLATTPPQLKRETGDEGVFAQIATGAKLYVPASSLAAYAKSSWSNYFDICVKEGDTTPMFTITFDTDGGSAVAPIIQEYKTAVTAPTNPTKAGYTFAGWDKTIPSTMPAGDMTIKAKWTAKTYTITFDTKGGSTVAPITQEYNTAVTAPAAPTKTGYTFDGWDKNIPSTMPAENVTITAKWKVNQYTITFNTDGGSSVATITQDYGTAVNAPANPTKEGYTFNGWNPALPSTMPAKNETHTAQWTINQYTITFDTDGGSAVSPIKQDYGTAVTAPAAPTKTGYTFAGWDTEVPTTMPAKDMTIKAKWTANQYTITFDTGGGTTIAAVTQNYGTSITKPSNPAKTGYTFAGWDTEVPTTMPAENVTITAKWTVNQYTITFNTDGGTAIEAITQDYNTAVTAPANPTKTGYTFAGWDKEVPSIMPAENVTITAQWTINKYTITFNTDGGTEIAAITQDYNTAVTAPVAPTKTGYTFAGWDKTIPSTMPAGDMTIKAKWTINKYTITFDTDGGSEIAAITQDYNTDVKAPAEPTKEGYSFTGWDKQIPGTMPAEDMTIKALWAIGQYSITFDTDGGTAVNSIVQDYGTAVTAPAAPTKEGYTFAGWEPAVPATMPEGGLTVKAQWTVNQYTITFDVDSGTAVDPISQDFGTEVTAPADPTKEGYTFAGWEPALPETMPVGGMTIKAKWTINQYTITFDTDGGSEIAAITQAYKSAVAAPAAPTKEGYTFAGWDNAVPSTMPAENVTITAQWTANQYTITFDVDGGTAVKPITQNYGTAVTAPAAPTKTGYTFAGWSPALPETMPAENRTVKATWTINQYTITFNTDGGSTVDPITQDYGTAVKAPTNPTKTGYTFAGWDVEIPATMPAENVTIKAKWTINKYTITFDTDGGSEIAAITQDYGTAVKAPTNPTKTGYTFAGWEPALPETMPVGGMTIKAQWTINQYTITFDTDGGSEIAAITQDYNTDVKAPAEPTKEGYTFIGWDVEIPATMPAENITIKAQWTYTPTIVDGDEYTATENMQAASLTYTRTLPNTKWNALYVPFEIPVSMLSDYEVAYVNDVHSYDTNDDGIIDDFSMEIIKIKSGVLNANYPYLIRAKNDGAKAMSITLNNITLYAAEETSVDCSSVVAEFKVTGTYRKIAGSKFSTNEYALSNGTWVPFAVDSELKPGRLYLQITEREGTSPVKVSTMAMTRINIHVKGEESSTSVEEMIMQGQQPKEEVIYDLMGRRVQNPVKGHIYIVNGKKRVY